MPKVKNKKSEVGTSEIATDLTSDNTPEAKPIDVSEDTPKDEVVNTKEFVVVVRFIDAISGKVYEVGETYPESSNERIETLLGKNMHQTAFIKLKAD
ncbi:hypothetical protein [Erysipelothrix aquatica]|uniref:hypothetical protein n=1 Tax=Erysipelothrix aquatica TaxID=2683714 RepID=UPI00135BE415|nr:hypothetical protein [Erysipelothrix aquatica]